MTTAQAIDRAHELRGLIGTHEAELKQCEAIISKAAERCDHVPLADGEREGTRAVLHGSERVKSLSVIYTADSLITSVEETGEPHDAMMHLLCVADEPKFAKRMLHRFFAPTTDLFRTIPNGVKFRRAVRELLPEDKAEQFLGLCIAKNKAGIPKSTEVIDWKNAEVISQ